MSSHLNKTRDYGIGDCGTCRFGVVQVFWVAAGCQVNLEGIVIMCRVGSGDDVWNVRHGLTRFRVADISLSYVYVRDRSIE